MLHFTDKETISESLSNLAKVTEHLRLQGLIHLTLMSSHKSKRQDLWRHGLSAGATRSEGITGTSQFVQLPSEVW